LLLLELATHLVDEAKGKIDGQRIHNQTGIVGTLYMGLQGLASAFGVR